VRAFFADVRRDLRDPIFADLRRHLLGSVVAFLEDEFGFADLCRRYSAGLIYNESLLQASLEEWKHK